MGGRRVIQQLPPENFAPGNPTVPPENSAPPAARPWGRWSRFLPSIQEARFDGH
jgi:hypothetical protein